MQIPLPFGLTRKAGNKMTYRLNDKVINLEPYEPIAGEFKIRLDANESYLGLSEKLEQRIAVALKQVAFNRYPDPLGKELCEAFAEFYGLSPELVTAGNGSDELISIIANTLAMRGEKCFTFAQDFSMYRFYGMLAECELHTLPLRDDLTIDVDHTIETLNREKAGILLFSNPCNPTSRGLTKEQVKKLVSSVNCLVVLDEAYMDFWNESMLDEVEHYDNLIILKTCSKAIGMAAIRLGFAVSNKTITNALRAVKSPYNVNSITQMIGTMILKEKSYLLDCTRKIIEGKDTLYREICLLAEKYPVLETVYPSATNFVYVKTELAQIIFSRMLERSIAIRCFKGHLRISTGSSEENQCVIQNLEEVLQEVQHEKS